MKRQVVFWLKLFVLFVLFPNPSSVSASMPPAASPRDISTGGPRAMSIKPASGLTMIRSRLEWVAGCVLAGLAPLLFLAALPAFAEQPGSDLPRPASQVIAASTLITYSSSIDEAALDYVEYLPAGYNPAVAYPMVILLHGAGGNVNQYDTPGWHTAADSHGYILAMAHARTLPGYGTSRLSFFMNGVLARGPLRLMR